ncbi:MAG: ABC transporter permease, partial [Rhodobacteraceae bacterium]|nr:ABC transporter permease [Paracoccaceae bacterium]
MASTDIKVDSPSPNKVVDKNELLKKRKERNIKIGKWVMPIIVFMITIYLWYWTVQVNNIPHYILPDPFLVVTTLIQDIQILLSALQVTIQITLMALAVAVVGGVGLAILFTQSKFFEISFFPYAVILQVTPIISIAPLIFIYVDNRTVGLLLCAWIVAFFPILSNTTLGLNSVDHNLKDLFKI